jgi:hypothetical protein
MTPSFERRLLQLCFAVGGLVPVGAGLWGVLGRWRPDSQARYLSGLLLGVGLVFWWTIPTLERRGAIVRVLAAVVAIGGLARLAGAPVTGLGLAVVLPLIMELGVTPLLALWRERVERRLHAPAPYAAAVSAAKPSP